MLNSNFEIIRVSFPFCEILAYLLSHACQGVVIIICSVLKCLRSGSQWNDQSTFLLLSNDQVTSKSMHLEHIITTNLTFEL